MNVHTVETVIDRQASALAFLATLVQMAWVEEGIEETVLTGTLFSLGREEQTFNSQLSLRINLDT